MRPVRASRKSSSQVFSAFNIGMMNVYMFLAPDRSSHAAESRRHWPRDLSYRRLGPPAQNAARHRIVIDKSGLADNPFAQAILVEKARRRAAPIRFSRHVSPRSRIRLGLPCLEYSVEVRLHFYSRHFTVSATESLRSREGQYRSQSMAKGSL